MTSLTEFYDKVSRKTDTGKTAINVAETKRVLACMFDCLEDESAANAAEIIAKGLKAASKRKR